MNYSTILCSVMATLSRLESSESEAVAQPTMRAALEPSLQALEKLGAEFLGQPVGPQKTFEFEQQLQKLLLEMGRLVMEFILNRVEPSRKESLPSHVEYDGTLYTRQKKVTPREISTTFGKAVMHRVGYRPTSKDDGGKTIFPCVIEMGIVEGATPALCERVANYQAEAGATERRTLKRLKDEQGVTWGKKKLRAVVGRVSEAMSETRHEVQVEKLLELLEKGSASPGKNKPVLSVGRDGITLGVPVKKGTIFEVASAGTVSVMDRRGERVGTVYLAYVPESLQVTMSEQLTRLLEEVLRRWEKPLPRLCYVTDAGDNETTYYEQHLCGMKHPRTGEVLEWIRVVDFYHASERLWTIAEALFGVGRTASAWARKMKELLKERNGIRRVLNSASVYRNRFELKKTRAEEYRLAYNYLRDRMEFMRYAAYKKLGIPRGSGVTEAACKTIYTQRLKLSGMRWKKSGAQTILNLRVILLSNVWAEAYLRVLKGFIRVQVPTYTCQRTENYAVAA